MPCHGWGFVHKMTSTQLTTHKSQLTSDRSWAAPANIARLQSPSPRPGTRGSVGLQSAGDAHSAAARSTYLGLEENRFHCCLPFPDFLWKLSEDPEDYCKRIGTMIFNTKWWQTGETRVYVRNSYFESSAILKRTSKQLLLWRHQISPALNQTLDSASPSVF